MKLYDSIGPNPRIVRMFMAEKGIELPKQTVDLRGGENRQPEHLKRNPHGQMPTLELDDGGYLSEITAICEYLEEKNPKPPMIGATPEQRAECRMWTRRVDLNICEPLANGYRFGEALKFFEKRIPCAPEASPGLKMIRQRQHRRLVCPRWSKAFGEGLNVVIARSASDEAIQLAALLWIASLRSQ
jgi:glutathione S-transferase